MRKTYNVIKYNKYFLDSSPHGITFNSFICSASQWTGLHMIVTSVMKELKRSLVYLSGDPNLSNALLFLEYEYRSRYKSYR